MRSADALGIGIGTLIGTLASTLGMLRTVYGVEAVCMAAVLVLISVQPLQDGPPHRELQSAIESSAPTSRSRPSTWIVPLLPVLVISVVATGILALQQSALPLDLVRGGLSRPALSESHSSALIALQLTLLVSLQWPVGRWLSDRSVAFGLGLSLAGFSVGCGLIAYPPVRIRHRAGAGGPAADGLRPAAFLPTTAEAVIEGPLRNIEAWDGHVLPVLRYQRHRGPLQVVRCWIFSNGLLLWLGRSMPGRAPHPRPAETALQRGWRVCWHQPLKTGLTTDQNADQPLQINCEANCRNAPKKQNA